jgi:hypothetical protein
MRQITKHGMYRDSQRQRVYEWEFVNVFDWVMGTTREARYQSIADRGLLSIAECQQLVDNLWHLVGIPSEPPTVVPRRGERGFACPGTNTIELPTYTRFKEYVIHEIAHHVVYETMKGRPHEWHGAEFVGCYILLLSISAGRDYRKLYDTARRVCLAVQFTPSIEKFKAMNALPHVDNS